MSFALCAPIANAALPRAPTERLATFTSNKKQNHQAVRWRRPPQHVVPVSSAAGRRRRWETHDVKQPTFPRPLTIRARAPRISPAFAGASFRCPRTTGSGAPRRRPGACEAPGGRAGHGTPGHSSRSARRPLRSGRRASRRSTRGDFRPWAALPSPGLSPGGRTAMLLAAGS